MLWMRRISKASSLGEVTAGAAAVWVDGSEIQSLIQAVDHWNPTVSHAWGVMLFPDYSFHTHTYTQPTLIQVGLNNKVVPAQVVYQDTKAIPHIN